MELLVEVVVSLCAQVQGLSFGTRVCSLCLAESAASAVLESHGLAAAFAALRRDWGLGLRLIEYLGAVLERLEPEIGVVLVVAVPVAVLVAPAAVVGSGLGSSAA